MIFNKKLVSLFLSVMFIATPMAFARDNETEILSNNVQAVETTQEPRYPDFGKMFIGEDKYEKFNRKMFCLNSKLNKFIARPVHVLWSSIMPKYGIDRIRDAYNNIEYPKRLASCIMQKDGQAAKAETLRFLTNSTIGLGGLFDPADKILKIKPTNENMEQALNKCKMKQGNYLVMPCLHACTPRSLCGRALEAALDPSVYLASPITSIVKFGLMLNRTSYMQPLSKMLESTYADPYDIQKKLFGLESYIKGENYDRANLIDNTFEQQKITGGAASMDTELLPLADNIESKLVPDIVLENFNSQTPVVDSMRTALFEDKEISKSMWNELSVWNRSFVKRIKTGSVEIALDRALYSFKYILQKDKNAPLIILYPSIGEGAGAHHSVVFAKKFYDEGYSVVMTGSHFHWEFVKSMPEGYCPGIPSKDVEKIKLVTSKILDFLQQKYDCKFSEKIIVGTSFGAMSTLFVADSESKEGTLGINKYIAISPPIELKYALEQLDKNSEEFDEMSENAKDKTAVTAAKVLQLSQIKENSKEFKPDALPFTEEEGKLITSFILRQKLSDLIFTIENVSPKEKTDIYEMINNMSYKDYAEKYLLNGGCIEDIGNSASLFSLADYLRTHDNYKIYHSLDDYFVNKNQLELLKNISGANLRFINCGSHLGFLYRKEFEEALMNDVKI